MDAEHNLDLSHVGQPGNPRPGDGPFLAVVLTALLVNYRQEPSCSLHLSPSSDNP